MLVTCFPSSLIFFAIAGDFSSFVILSKSGSPVPQDFPFSESTKRDVWSPPRTPFGTLRRSLSRSSLRHRGGTLHKNSKFPSMFSLRPGSAKFSRRSFWADKSSDSIDNIPEAEEAANSRDSRDLENEVSTASHDMSSLDNSFDERPEDVATSTPGKQKADLPVHINGGEKRREKSNPFNGYEETHFDLSEEQGEAVSRDILEEVIDNIGLGPDSPGHQLSYDDRKNPFIEELYDESLSAA